MRIIIDKIQGDMAVLERDGKTYLEVKTSSLPQGAREGDILKETTSGLEIDAQATSLRRKEIETLLDDIFSGK